MNILSVILRIIPELARQVLALFIVVDPLGNIPIIISLTKDLCPSARREAFRTATVVGLVLLSTFAVVGDKILSFFRVTLSDLMIAGGVLLFIIAVRIIVSGGRTGLVKPGESVGAVPIAVPLLVGPGAITTTIVSLRSSGVLITLLSILIVFSLVGAVFYFIEPLHRFLGKTGSVVIERVMAMLLTTIAVSYILTGLKETFPLA